MKGLVLSISIVIPWSKRGGRESKILETLAADETLPKNCEIIVVHDAGYPPDSVPIQVSPCVHLIEVKREGIWKFAHPAGLKRNKGAHSSSGDRLLFLDSDCLVVPGCVAMHASVTKDNVVVCGVLDEVPYEHVGTALCSNDVPLSIVVPDHRRAEFTSAASNVVGFEYCYSANLSVSRELFLATGGFPEEGFRCHDIHFGLKAQQIGAKIVFNPDAVVAHLEHPRSLDHRRSQAAGILEIGRLYPAYKQWAAQIVHRMSWSYATAYEKSRYEFERLSLQLGADFICRRAAFFKENNFAEVLDKLKAAGLVFASEPHGNGRSLLLRSDRNCWDNRFIWPASPDARETTIAVVIPVYNGEGELDDLLSSIASQTELPDEVLVIDDGSTDQTALVAQRFEPILNLRVIFHAKNIGMAAALNSGIDHCRSDIILHLDSDDILAPDAISIVLDEEQLNNDVAMMVYSPIDYQSPSKPPQEASDYLFTDHIYYPRVYRRQALLAQSGWRTDDPYGGTYCEDRWITYRMANAYPQVHVSSNKIAHVRNRKTSLSRQKPKLRLAAKASIIELEAADSGVSLSFKKKNNHFLTGSFHPYEASTASWRVVIPCHNDTWSLHAVLKSWQAVRKQHDGQLEIIVVDDGNDKPIDPAFVSSMGARLIRHSKRSGPAAARNSGAALRGNEFDYLFFCDSDIIVSPFTLAAHEARYRTSDRPENMALFSGWTRPKLNPELIKKQHLDGEGNRTYEVLLRKARPSITDKFWLEELVEHFDRKIPPTYIWARTGTGAMSVSYRGFDMLGGFNESFCRLEDWEFSLRLATNGGVFEFIPGIPALHIIRERLPTWESEAREAAAKLLAEYSIQVGALKGNPKLIKCHSIQELLELIDRNKSKNFDNNGVSLKRH